jgi:3-phosphoshikimate 1-carboxyvinyltransferase
MKLIVQPGNPLRGTVNVSGDKSLSHRAMLFAALAEGESHISNFLLSGVTRVMLEALGTLGIKWRIDGRELIIHGCGINGLKTPSLPINCGNSATTMRLLAGALAASGVPVVLDGSPGLRRRPMSRIVAPLRRMGVKIDTAEGGVAPLTIAGRDRAQSLIPLNETLPVASAQVKSCLLLAALSAAGESVIREPGPSRDHTERMLSSMGVCVEKFKVEERGTVSYETRIQPLRKPLSPLVMNLPGDISAAAFLIVAALITPGSEIYISGVGINPTRTGIIEALQKMGGDIRILNQSLQAGEPVGDIMVRFSPLSGIDVFGR